MLVFNVYKNKVRTAFGEICKEMKTEWLLCTPRNK